MSLSKIAEKIILDAQARGIKVANDRFVAELLSQLVDKDDLKNAPAQERPTREATA
jgi:type III secretion system FlhB-like substrate exporter